MFDTMDMEAVTVDDPVWDDDENDAAFQALVAQLTDEANAALDQALRHVVSQGAIDTIKSFIQRRSDYVMSLIPREFTIDSGSDAGSRYLLDENARRRRVGLISAEPIDLTQQLLSPLYYLTRALEPFADLSVPESEELSAGIAELLEQRPSVIVMADIGTIPDDVEDRLFE